MASFPTSESEPWGQKEQRVKHRFLHPNTKDTKAAPSLPVSRQDDLHLCDRASESSDSAASGVREPHPWPCHWLERKPFLIPSPVPKPCQHSVFQPKNHFHICLYLVHRKSSARYILFSLFHSTNCYRSGCSACLLLDKRFTPSCQTTGMQPRTHCSLSVLLVTHCTAHVCIQNGRKKVSDHIHWINRPGLLWFSLDIVYISGFFGLCRNIPSLSLLKVSHACSSDISYTWEKKYSTVKEISNQNS